MSACTFFGHRDCYDAIEHNIQETVEELIINGTNKFYVGNQGMFDRKVIKCLSKIRQKHSEVEAYIVLAYMPTTKAPSYELPTVYPEGLEKVPPKYAIRWRNEWMISNSEYVITYVRNTVSNAYTFESLARLNGKKVIKI